MNSTPFSSQTCNSSATSIGLEASEICVSPWQNASKPSLVPAPPTSMRASGFSSRNNSAAAWVIGCTVLEPSTRMLPETLSPPPPPPWLPPALPPQAATTTDKARRPATTIKREIPLNPYAPFVEPRKTTADFQGTILGHCFCP